MNGLRQLGLAVVLACGLAAGPAESSNTIEFEDPSAAAEFRRADEAWSRGDFAAAAEALDTAYTIEPHDDLLYARAQARRKLDNCADALVLYESYLETHPRAADKIADAETNIARCRAELEVAPPTPDGQTAAHVHSASLPLPPAAVDTSGRASAPARDDVRPWHRDPLAATLVGVGVAALGTGGLLWRSTAIAIERTRTAGTYGEFRRARQASTRRQAAAASFTAVGSAMIVGGIIRWLLVRHNNRRARQTATTGSGRQAGGQIGCANLVVRCGRDWGPRWSWH